MANEYKNLKEAIKQAIKQNGNQEITGQLLQSTLLNIVNTIGAEYKFLGFASPSTVPPTSEEGKLFYFASTTGNYVNFPISAEANEYIIIEGEGLYLFTKEADSNYWKVESLISIAQELGDAEDKVMSQKVVSIELSDLSSMTFKKGEDFPLFSNLYNANTLSKNHIIKEDGSIIESNYYHVTDYLPIDKKFSYVYSHNSCYKYTDNASYAFFREDKSLINASKLVKESLKLTEIPSDAAYIRFSLRIIDENDASLFSYRKELKYPAQETGDSEELVMSQKSVTKEFMNINSEIKKNVQDIKTIEYKSFADALYLENKKGQSDTESFTAIDTCGQFLGNALFVADTIDLHLTSDGGVQFSDSLKMKFATVLEGQNFDVYKTVDLSKVKLISGSNISIFFGKTVIKENTVVIFEDAKYRVYFTYTKGEYDTPALKGLKQLDSNYRLIFKLYRTSEPLEAKVESTDNALKEVNSKLQEVKLDTEKNRNSLFGNNYQQSLGWMFLDRGYNNVIFISNPIEFDNAIVKKVKFYSYSSNVTIYVCSIDEDRKIHIKDSYTSDVTTDSSVELDCWLKADKGDFIALSRVGYSSYSGIKTKVSIASSLEEGSVVERDEDINIQFAYDYEVQSDVKEIGICEINDILKFDVVKSTDSYTFDSSLNVSTDNSKLHIKNNSIPANMVAVNFCRRFFVKGHYYFAYCKLKSNLQTKKMNGFGLSIGDVTLTSNSYRSPVDDSDKDFELYGLQLFDGDNRMYDVRFFVYPIVGMSEGTFIDLYIEKVQIIDLGVDKPRISEYYKNLVKYGDYKPKFTYSTISASSISHSLYKGLKLKSLGDSLPETRSYQYIVANELGAEYDGDPDNFNYVDDKGVSQIGRSHTIGGTWCAPVTTKQGDSTGAGGENTQSINMSAYMRARTLKYLKPDILIIECGTNDAVDAENVEIYKGKNPQGEIAHDHGINDPAYTGDGVDCSDGVYQDDRGYNKAPSLGASYRGMLKQIFSDMPNIKVVCLGCPYDKLSMETSPSKVDLYYKDTRLKNAVIKKVASEFGCIYIDIAEEGYGPNAYNINLLTIDGLHFSSQGGRRIAELILAKL